LTEGIEITKEDEELKNNQTVNQIIEVF
jgi:hypothetical protein